MLTHCLLSWAGHRPPIYPLFTISRSLGFHIAPTLAVSFLEFFEALRERDGTSNV